MLSAAITNKIVMLIPVLVQYASRQIVLLGLHAILHIVHICKFHIDMGCVLNRDMRTSKRSPRRQRWQSEWRRCLVHTNDKDSGSTA